MYRMEVFTTKKTRYLFMNGDCLWGLLLKILSSITKPSITQRNKINVFIICFFIYQSPIFFSNISILALEIITIQVTTTYFRIGGNIIMKS
jgi:hypothetical protein